MDSMSRMSSMLEAARDLTIDAAREASALRRSQRPPPSISQLKKLLDSRRDNEILEGLRGVIARTAHAPQNGPPLLFSTVIKNIASPSLAVKKLVYIYLLQNAEAEPDTALLAINTIQKSLSAPDAQLRALALRVMSGIRVPVISQIVSLGIKKGCGDMSPLVRKAAALAIPKCWRLDPNTAPQLLEYLSLLLGDRQYFVAGSAVAAFLEVCPERIDLLHKHYRGLVKKLVDMDEWGQLATLRMMLDYARRCFPRKAVKQQRGGGGGAVAATGRVTEGEAEDVFLDSDLELLLKSALPLLQSRNSAVVVAVTRLYLYLAPPKTSYFESAIGPMVSLLRGSQDMQEIAYYNLIQVALIRPASLVQYATRFLVRSTDTPRIWSPKLELLTIVFPHGSSRLQSLILSEFSHFSNSSSSPDLVRDAVRAIGRCAQSSSPSSVTSSRCLQLLFAQLGSANGELVAESLTIIRHLIQADPTAHVDTVTRLAKNLDTMTNPNARASIIWLVGEFAGINGGNNIAADVLRILAKGFADEAEPTKLQIVLLAAKVYVHHLNGLQESKTANNEHSTEDDMGDDRIGKLWQYVLLLVRYDISYDLRDRARVYKALLSVPSSTQLATLLLLAPKPVPHTPSPSESRRDFTLGSASLVLGTDEIGATGLPGYNQLPEWVEAGKEPDPRLRDSANEIGHNDRAVITASERLNIPGARGKAASASASSSNNSPALRGATGGKSLDDWLAESEAESESEGEDEDTSEDGSTEGSDSGEDVDNEDDEEDSSEEESEDDEGEQARLMKD